MPKAPTKHEDEPDPTSSETQSQPTPAVAQTQAGARREQTFGEKAVGLSFNPSGDADVDKLKRLYAEIIDICHNHRLALMGGSEKVRLWSVAITEAQGAQMWAVKAATWKD